MDHPVRISAPSQFLALPQIRQNRLPPITPQGMPYHGQSIHYLGSVYDLASPRDDWPTNLCEILDARPDVGRAMYGAALLDEYRLRPLDLAAEHAVWMLRLQQFVQRYIKPGLIDDLDPAEHWLWTKTYVRGPHPTTNYYSAHNILVVRLTWLAFKPDIVLPPDKNPRKLASCPDDDILRRCVNPHHYEVVWERLDPAPNPAARRGLADGRTPKAHRWLIDDQDRVCCQDCGQPASLFTQSRYQQGFELPRYIHCPRCYSERMDQSGYLGWQVRGTLALGKRSLRDWEIEEDIHRALMEKPTNAPYVPEQDVVDMSAIRPDPNEGLEEWQRI